jgi:hypothetical protein
MAKATWEFSVGGRQHKVRLEHRFISGKREIWVDGSQLDLGPDSKPAGIDRGSRHQFEIANHECIVEILTNGLAFRYDLFVDGKPIATGKQLAPNTATGTFDVEKVDRSIRLAFLIPLLVFGIGSIAANVFFVLRSGVYFPELSYVGSLLLVLSIYVAFFRNEDGSIKQMSMVEGVLALIATLALGVAVNFLISGRIY